LAHNTRLNQMVRWFEGSAQRRRESPINVILAFSLERLVVVINIILTNSSYFETL